MPTKKHRRPPLLEVGVANVNFPGQAVCGDLHLVEFFPNGALVAVVDGLGHGQEAALAAQIAVAAIQEHADESVLALLKRCNEALCETRGAVMTLATFHEIDGTITWTGVGNVEAVLIRAEGQPNPPREYVLLHGGVVGNRLPPLRAFVLPVGPGDTLIMATDGIRSGFAEGLTAHDSPQRLAARILAHDAKGTDDALVLVARYQGESS